MLYSEMMWTHHKTTQNNLNVFKQKTVLVKPKRTMSDC